MNQIKCERCGGSEFIEKEGHLICVGCNNEFSISIQGISEKMTELKQEDSEQKPEIDSEQKPEPDPERNPENNPEETKESESESEVQTGSLSPETYRVVDDYIAKRRRKKRRKRISNTILGVIVLILLLWVILSFLMKYNVITFVPQEISMFSVFDKLSSSWNALRNQLF